MWTHFSHCSAHSFLSSLMQIIGLKSHSFCHRRYISMTTTLRAAQYFSASTWGHETTPGEDNSPGKNKNKKTEKSKVIFYCAPHFTCTWKVRVHWVWPNASGYQDNAVKKVSCVVLPVTRDGLIDRMQNKLRRWVVQWKTIRESRKACWNEWLSVSVSFRHSNGIFSLRISCLTPQK